MEGNERGGAPASPSFGAGSADDGAGGALHREPGADLAAPSPTRAANVASSGAAPPGGNGHGGNASAYAALDLGTNNCRLLVARPSPRGFKVIDAFSRIIRLGEGRGGQPPPVAGGDRAHHRCLEGVRGQDRHHRVEARRAHCHGSLPAGRQRAPVPQPRPQRDRPRHPGRQPRSGSTAGGFRLRLADRLRAATWPSCSISAAAPRS